MNMKNRYALSLLHLLSALLLISLVPGGPIENRDFSHIDPAIFLGFNIYLTLLGLGSLFLVPLIIKGWAWVWKASLAASVSYPAVYLLDLLKIFPQTPSPMPSALFWIEVIGTILALPMVCLSIRGLNACHQQREKSHPDHGDSLEGISRKGKVVLLSLSMLLALSIVLFATWSAMHSGS